MSTLRSKYILLVLCVSTALATAPAHSEILSGKTQTAPSAEVLNLQGLEKLVDQITQQPEQALQQIVAALNNYVIIKSGTSAGDSVRLKFLSSQHASAPYLQLVASSEDASIVELVADSRARTNPFFLLEAIVELRKIYELNWIGFDGKNATASSSPPTLRSLLGLPLSSFVGKSDPRKANVTIEPLHREVFLELLANAKAGSIFAQRKLAELTGQALEITKSGFDSFAPITAYSLDQRSNFLREFAASKNIVLSTNGSYQTQVREFEDRMLADNETNLRRITKLAQSEYAAKKLAYSTKAKDREQIVTQESLSDMVKAND
ncbi:MAG: hypothetical protein EOP06_23290, partial [Proteobacteria bacterium]